MHCNSCMFLEFEVTIDLRFQIPFTINDVLIGNDDLSPLIITCRCLDLLNTISDKFSGLIFKQCVSVKRIMEARSSLMCAV